MNITEFPTDLIFLIAHKVSDIRPFLIVLNIDKNNWSKYAIDNEKMRKKVRNLVKNMKTNYIKTQMVLPKYKTFVYYWNFMYPNRSTVCGEIIQDLLFYYIKLPPMSWETEYAKIYEENHHESIVESNSKYLYVNSNPSFIIKSNEIITYKKYFNYISNFNYCECDYVRQNSIMMEAYNNLNNYCDETDDSDLAWDI